MPTLLQTIRLLAIVVWVGGIVFFAFVLAPNAFRLLPSAHMAGIVVGGTLRVFDIVALVCGGIFGIATAILFGQSQHFIERYWRAQLFLAAIMFLATAYLHFGILRPMENDRVAAGGDIEASPATNPAHIHFERLHKRSEQVEAAVLFCGLGIVVLMARESLPARK